MEDIKKTEAYMRMSERKKMLYEVIFESNTLRGKVFDEILLVVILLSVVAVMLESIDSIKEGYGLIILIAEAVFTALFAIEYIFRVYCYPKPKKYITSFLGVVDLLAIVPSLISFAFPAIRPFITLRAIRLLRVYRILKLFHFMRESKLLLLALASSFRKIFVFMGFILVLVILLGSIMYVVEGGKSGFDSIPLSIYWAVITITTVGYGDIVPLTDIGKAIATLIMLMGYSIIAIPTGIVSVEISRSAKRREFKKHCSYCDEIHHLPDSSFCQSCGARLDE